jgi:hypothetical protein
MKQYRWGLKLTRIEATENARLLLWIVESQLGPDETEAADALTQIARNLEAGGRIEVEGKRAVTEADNEP